MATLLGMALLVVFHFHLLSSLGALHFLFCLCDSCAVKMKIPRWFTVGLLAGLCRCQVNNDMFPFLPPQPGFRESFQQSRLPAFDAQSYVRSLPIHTKDS